MLHDKHVVLCVTGGIAAYKAAELCSQLRKAGAHVRVAMTESAKQFVAPLTFEALTQHHVYSAVLHDERSYEMEHISWAKWAEILLIAPASANIIAKLAHGLADDAVSTLALSFPGQTIVAPAMNTQMLAHPATAHNLELLRSRGVQIIEPATGMLACGDVGPGKLAGVDDILHAIQQMAADIPERPSQDVYRSVEISAPPAEHVEHGEAANGDAPTATQRTAVQSAMQGLRSVEFADRDDSLKGRTVLITSGPTHEYLDPVRFLTNPSSGKMGYALAREAARRGATVHFVTGPVAPSMLPTDCAKIHRVETAEQMLNKVRSLVEGVSIFVFAAAVSDFRVANPPEQKIKRTGNSMTLPLIENPDIAQAIGHIKQPTQLTVGFAAETNDMEANAVGKMNRKKLDAIVANDVANPRIGFDRDENEVTIYLRNGARVQVSRRPKSDVAREIFDCVISLFSEPAAS